MGKTKRKTTGQPRPLQLNRIVRALDGLDDQELSVILNKIIQIFAKRAVNPYRNLLHECDEEVREKEQ